MTELELLRAQRDDARMVARAYYWLLGGAQHGRAKLWLGDRPVEEGRPWLSEQLDEPSIAVREAAGGP